MASDGFRMMSDWRQSVPIGDNWRRLVSEWCHLAPIGFRMVSIGVSSRQNGAYCWKQWASIGTSYSQLLKIGVNRSRNSARRRQSVSEWCQLASKGVRMVPKWRQLAPNGIYWRQLVSEWRQLVSEWRHNGAEWSQLVPIGVF